MTGADLIAAIKKHPLAFLCGLIALGCVAWMFYYRGSESEELQSTYDDKSRQATRMVANVRNSDRLPQQLEEIRELSKEMESRLVSAANLGVNLQYFYRLEAETGVRFNDLRQNAAPRAPKTGSLYIGVPYSVTVQGTYAQVMRFISQIENGTHFARFTHLDFIKSNAQGPDGMRDASEELMTVTMNLELLGKP